MIASIHSALALGILLSGFDVRTMAEFDVDRNAAVNGYGVDFVHSVTLGHGLGRSNLGLPVHGRNYTIFSGLSARF